jgi:hypothetical protein
MPFKSEAQRRYLWAREPEIARDWTDEYGSRIQKENGGIMRLGFQNGNDVDPWWLRQIKKGQEKIGDIWSGITESKPAQFAITPMMALASRYNPLSPDAVNFNPMLEGQRDLALRSIDQGGLGLTQDDIGRFLGSGNPDDPDYNPLRGQNLVSMFGTNDLQEMLRKRLAYFRAKKYQSETKTKKMNKIQEMLEQAKADESKGYTGTPAGQIGTGPFATIDQSGKTYGPYTPQVKTRGTFTGAHPDRPTKTPEQGGWHPGVADGGLIDFYKNGGFSG